MTKIMTKTEFMAEFGTVRISNADIAEVEDNSRELKVGDWIRATLPGSYVLEVLVVKAIYPAQNEDNYEYDVALPPSD